MPCVAKKAECDLPTMRTQTGPDVDLALTTREFVRMVRADKLAPAYLPEEPMDSPMGVHTGAGAIFGVTGGVMEAALRTAVYTLTGENPNPDSFAQVRTGPGLREATYEITGIPVRCAVVSGLGNARQLIERLKTGKVHYDFVEVMPALAAAWEAADSPFPRRMRNLPAFAASGCTSWTEMRLCVFPMKTHRFRLCTPSFWVPPSARKRRLYCTLTIRGGICRINSRDNYNSEGAAT